MTSKATMLQIMGLCHSGYCFYRNAMNSTDNAVLSSVFRHAARNRSYLYADLIVHLERSAFSPAIFLMQANQKDYQDFLRYLQENAHALLFEHLEKLEQQLLKCCDTLLACPDYASLHPALQAHLPLLQETYQEIASLARQAGDTKV